MQHMPAQQQIQDGRNDFDFLIGDWHVHSRRLRERLQGSDDWESFEGQFSAQKVLGGLGNMDEVTFERESGTFRGLTLRLFNPDAQEWSIYWASDANPTGALDVPMVGKFTDGVGRFYAHETHAGQHVFSRFIWTVISPDACKWEQALSQDGGQTWETNWTMEFTK